MIEILLTNGDRAEALTPEGAVLAAQTMMREARDQSAYGGHGLTATFVVEGQPVRTGIRYDELCHSALPAPQPNVDWDALEREMSEFTHLWSGGAA